MNRRYGQVLIDSYASQLDRLFTYIIDDDLIDIAKEGMRVVIPFGKGNKPIKGLLVAIVDEFDESYKLKNIIEVLDDKPIISKELLKLGYWIKNEYLCTYFEALQPILPPGDYKQVNTFVELNDDSYNPQDREEEKIINYLKNKEIVLLLDLKNDLKLPYINNYLNRLEELDVIETTIDIVTTVKKKKEKWVKLLSNDLSLNEINQLIGKRANKQLIIAEYLFNNGDISINSLIKELNTTLSTIKSLEEKKIVKIYDKELYRDPIKKYIPKYNKHKLNQDQSKVFNRILSSIKKENSDNKFLIHGVTGSGKTEIYLQLVEEMLKKGKDSIVLVPEISLTPQTIDRFVGRFGENVAILHSRLSQGERFDQWRSIKKGRVKIVVGARSAIFAPFNNIGLIIIDEEHESTYKSSQNPKYDTIEVASKRVDLENAFLVLGTATPSLETYYKSLKDDIVLLKLNERANKQDMPEIHLVDMREELKDGNRSIFSIELQHKMREALDNHKQIILFLNRRGFSTFVSCRECGYVVKCDNCDISMTYYKNINKLRCNYCGVTENIPTVCPVCHSKYIKYFGIGTEKVEELIKEMFPEANIVRMDGDTTTRKGSYEVILDDMKNKKIDILIGTQMISKGLDFENVVLVGIIAADTTLNLPDYKSPEKTFQLVTQVAGRAGRGDDEGNVILQTYNPEHYSIIHAKNQDYDSFYNTETKLREEFLYPPFINLMNILIYGENLQKVGKLSKDIYNIVGKEIYNIYASSYRDYIIGPYPAPLEKIKRNYRYQIILKIEEVYKEELKNLIYRVCIINEYNLKMDDIKISIDINPNTIL
ncbi:MAG: primosomal protein N' [Tissierellaceae bacterium]|nr:primosomal protein N' [Tissierellaceae bacterium]